MLLTGLFQSLTGRASAWQSESSESGLLTFWFLSSSFSTEIISNLMESAGPYFRY